MRLIRNKITVSIVVNNFAASLRPIADVAYKPPGGTYFHAAFGKVQSNLAAILINLREIESILASHIACLVDFVLECLVTHA